MARIALMVASTTAGREYTRPSQLELFRFLIPTLVQTLSHQQNHVCVLYLGFDAGDRYYDEGTNQKDLVEEFERVTSGCPCLEIAPLVCCPGPAGSPCAAWNRLFATAYEDGCDYFYQLSDDVCLQTQGWSDDFVADLEGRDLACTGPVDPGNDRSLLGHLLTNCFVSRRHLEVFGSLYPRGFKNWYSDDWISGVYLPHHHHQTLAHWARNQSGYAEGPRYDIDRGPIAELKFRIEEGRQRLAQARESTPAPLPERAAGTVMVAFHDQASATNLECLQQLVPDQSDFKLWVLTERPLADCLGRLCDRVVVAPEGLRCDYHWLALRLFLESSAENLYLTTTTTEHPPDFCARLRAGLKAGSLPATFRPRWLGRLRGYPDSMLLNRHQVERVWERVQRAATLTSARVDLRLAHRYGLARRVLGLATVLLGIYDLSYPGIPWHTRVVHYLGREVFSSLS